MKRLRERETEKLKIKLKALRKENKKWMKKNIMQQPNKKLSNGPN